VSTKQLRTERGINDQRAETMPQHLLRRLPAGKVNDGANDDVVASSNFRPHFQPIVIGNNHELYAFEALLRIPGVSTADALFRRWESTGEVTSIDAAMVRRVRTALQVRERRAAVTVNASALTVALAPENYLAEVAELVKVAELVVVEVTETFPVLKFSQLLDFANNCKALGAAFALDDCTPEHEYCNQPALRQLRPQLLKLDGGFFTDAYKRGDGAALEVIAELANDIGAFVVAEHVETAAMGDWAVAHGAHLLQGFYFGAAKPLSTTTPPARGVYPFPQTT